ncbi:MAG: nucleotidyltransferase domain-containing protein [Nanoarchaeota archaeon]|nr:nucleotidyltransferase domain-containing protein [Nanoarchaeota archaeon]
MQKELSLVAKKIKVWIKENKVLDVILFGSSAREKFNPNDIDLCILVKDDHEAKSLDLVDSLGKLTDRLKLESHINILTSGSFIKGNTLAKTLLNEGYSIKNNKPFSSIMGFENKSLFIYTLKHFSPSKRVKFHYLLKGRYGQKGVLKEVQGMFLGTGSIIIPTEKENLLKEIFEKWDVRYEIKRVLMS